MATFASGRPALSWRTHCTACGTKKSKVWGPGRSTLAKHCPNTLCHMHGIPQLFSVKVVVTFDRLGRRHIAHKEFAVRRRPTFPSPPSVDWQPR